MSILMSIVDADGKRHQCDAKCYNGTGKHCNCMCRGKNHGAGLKQAKLNTIELTTAELYIYCKENNITDAQIFIDQNIRQTEAF